MKHVWFPRSLVAVSALVLSTAACPPISERQLSVTSLRAEATVPYAPATVLFSGQVAMPEGGITVTATVDFGDGDSADLDLSSDGKFELTHDYAAAGTYAAEVEVSTDTGDKGHATTHVTLFERLHGVTIDCVTCDGSGSCMPMSCGNPAPARLTLRATSQGGMGAVRYLWRFSDGSPAATGNLVSHQFTQYGGQTVTVVAQDIRSSDSTGILALDVQSGLPETVLIARAQGPSSGAVPFTAKLSITALGEGPMTLTVGWNDGEIVSFGEYPGDDSAVTSTHTFEAAGTYTVYVSATDRLGNVVRETAQFRATN